MDLTALDEFAAAVGTDGPVACVGGRTQWTVGGVVDASAREVRAPAGVVEFVPAEMVVRCGAGTTLEALRAVVGEAGMTVAIEGAPGATVGGALSVGRSGVRALGWGPLRDVLLEARFVTSKGRVAKAGGPVVKNVSGFDLCRVLVGALGTLGFLGEVVLRCRPLPAVSRWFAAPVDDPFALVAALYRPSSVLWDGTTTWVLLEGHPADVDAQAADVLGCPFAEVEGPPPLPAGGRLSMRPGELRSLAVAGPFVAQLGVGIVYTESPAAARTIEPGVAELHRRLKTNFDPTNRLNPGRVVHQ